MSNSTENKPVFKLRNLTPVGFKVENYPTEICLVCRGPLLSVCIRCRETNNEVCIVTKHSNNYYHTHCLNLINTADK